MGSGCVETIAVEKIGSMMDLLDRFRTEEDCVEHLYQMKVEDGWTCPRWGCHFCSLLISRRKVQCMRCSHQESVTRGTTMYQTYEPLRKWFVAVYLVAIDKRGVCASSLPRAAREVGVGLLHARPHSSRRRCHILLAVWRYFFQFVTSWSSHSWIRGLYGSSFEGLDMTALGDQVSIPYVTQTMPRKTLSRRKPVPC